MSITQHIIETVEEARRIGAVDDELDQLLLSIGCTRIVHFANLLIVYYFDEGDEHFLVIEPLSCS